MQKIKLIPSAGCAPSKKRKIKQVFTRISVGENGIINETSSVGRCVTREFHDCQKSKYITYLYPRTPEARKPVLYMYQLGPLSLGRKTDDRPPVLIIREISLRQTSVSESCIRERTRSPLNLPDFHLPTASAMR